MTRILEDNDFEALRFLDEKSETNQLAVEELRKIFTQMFQNTEADANDFYFTIVDDKNPNAFFVSKNNTPEQKKHIIAISWGLVEACQNEAELAGIVGHECGHFLWGELLKGDNSIFQEHAADLRAVDLLINGGYNPRHHVEICKRILGDYGHVRYSDISIDVHGNGLARIDDINDYLTYIASQKGDIKSLETSEDKDYISFQQALKKAYEKEGYDTYIEKCLKQDLGTKAIFADKEKNIKGVSVFDVMGVFLKEMKQGNITPEKPVRFSEMCHIMHKYSDAKAFDSKTPAQIKLCQDFFLEMHRQVENTDFRQGIFRRDDQAHRHHVDTVCRVLGNFKIETFGDFKTQKENVDHFVHYQSKEDAIHWAEEMYKLRWTFPYKKAFTDGKYAHLEAKKEQQIGKMFPWVELEKFKDEEKDNNALQWAVETVTSQQNKWFLEYYSTQYNDKDYAEDSRNKYYFCDENGIVIAYGEEAQRMHENAEFAAQHRLFLKACQDEYKSLQENLTFYDALAEFDMATDAQTQDKYAEAIIAAMTLQSNYFKEYGGRPFISVKNSPNPMYAHNPCLEQIQELYASSVGANYFVTAADTVSHIFNAKERYAQRKDKEKRAKEWCKTDEEYQKYIKTLDEQEIVGKISDETYSGNNWALKKKTSFALLKLALWCRQHQKETLEEKIYEEAIKHINQDFYINRNYHSEETKEDKQLKGYHEKNSEELRDIYFKQIMTSPLMIRKSILRHDNRRTTMDSLVMNELEIKHLKSSSFLDRAMKTMGLNPLASFGENIKILEDTIGGEVTLHKGYNYYTGDIFQQYRLQRSLYDESYDTYRSISHKDKSHPLIEFYTEAGILMLANTIKRGNDWDLKDTMKHLRFSHSCSFYHPLVSDMIAESIEKENKFYPMSLQDKLYVYESMNNLELFSEKYANKNEFFKAIVQEIINLPDKDKAMEYTEKLLSCQHTELNSNNRTGEIEFAKEKNILIAFYAKCKAETLGIDDGSDKFLEKATQCADEICADLDYRDDYGSHHTEQKFSRDIRNAILHEISNNIVSQELTAQELETRGKIEISGKDAEKYDWYARVSLAVVAALAKSPQHAKVVIDFLSSKCTDESIEKVFESLPESYDLRRGKELQINNQELGIGYEHKFVFDNSTLKLVHENFWQANLPARAYIMKRILNAYTSDVRTEDERKKKKLDLVVDMYFDKKSPYYQDAKLVVNSVYNNLQDYEQDLILGALVSANQQNTGQQKMGGEAIGEGLKMFFENKGPAFVKFGQMLSYLPQLDSDIRKPLAKLRDKADLPTRAELFNLLKETLPNEELAKITRVDEILGAGSFFVTAKIKYENKDCVVAIMRPYATELSASGMDMINRTIEDLAKADSKYVPLRNIAYQAKLSAESETDIDADYAKYREAVKIYNDVCITTSTGEFNPQVAKWESYGSGKDGKVYKIMNMAKGMAMTSSKMTETEKHDMAVAYTALELCNLLSGARWDTDRHQGQQNFSSAETRDDGFKKFIIGIFDTGAQIQHDPNRKDKILLGEMLYGMARAARLGQNISDYMMSKVKSIDKIGSRLGLNTLYIDEVQRGLTALSDIITYQKEQKDEKGNVVVKEKSLSGEELGQIVNAILSSGLVDRDVARTLKTKAILNKLRPLRKGWVSSLSEGLHKITSTIKIEKRIADRSKSEELPRKDKPQAEIQAIQTEENKTRILGVSTKHIRSDAKTSSISSFAALR